MKNKLLWEEIAMFEIDNPTAQFPFSSRLKKENKWSYEYTFRAITEYKKFMYLATISKNSVSPSSIIDEVWHLHLIYTQSYWMEFCKICLGKNIHHIPTNGGNSESTNYQNIYVETLKLYEQEFGEKAPTDIWILRAQKRKIQDYLYLYFYKIKNIFFNEH